ncbi:MAG: efflux RND transporter permease subunit [Phycisphaerales bacterium]|nr:efflux RND transporter permease subunit [Phycisphaerales bacterium]MCB9856923.1 efflux RND transporter permease subunit [Phycisphaerales bacterium]MCB9861950.1 efflux RND transporter permease subunit [Phycisphaerales bacterium]
MTSLPRFSVNNPVIVNLMMVSVIVAGIYASIVMVREMFPETTPNQVRITTIYPGATPSEVEKGISSKIEEIIKDVDGVEELQTTNSEGVSSIAAVLYNDVDDVDQVVTDIKSAIDTIPRDEFPEDAEEPQVVKFEPQLPVINVSFYGDFDDHELKAYGRRLKDDILMIPGVTKARLQGTRNDEISVEVMPEKLIEYNLSLPQIRDAIAAANLDLPAGRIKTSSANVAVRTLGEEDRAAPISETIIRSDASGKVIRLRDVAEVHDTFEDVDVVSRFNASPAVTVTAYKTPSQDAIDISRKVQALVAGKTGRPLEQDWLDRLKYTLGFSGERERVEVYRQAQNDPYPKMGTLKTSTNLARFIEGRLELLTRNGFWGLVWVFASLLLFLNWRVAFWVMAGLIVSVLGTLFAMHVLGQTLNLISMFGLIIVLGILVDDAIVVGEHVHTKIEQGVPPKQAAIEGTEEVTWPVVAAVTTTIVAFAPLVFIEGRMGDFMGVLPVIVSIALSVSLIEALTILPSHLAEWLKPHKAYDPHALSERMRDSMKHVRNLQAFVIQGVLLKGYDRLLQAAVRNRYVTMAVMFAMLMFCGGLVGGGRVGFVFMPKMDSETVVADLRMPVGSPINETEKRIETIETAIQALSEKDSLYTLIGSSYGADGSDGSAASHIGQAILELKPVEQRDRTSDDIIRELRSKTNDLSGIQSLKFASMTGGPAGMPIDIEIRGDRLNDLVAASAIVKDKLKDFDGVFDVLDDFDAGRREVQIELLPSARALGITTTSLATQVRGAFYGLEAKTIARDREDVKIMVRYPESRRRRIYDLESMRIATPTGRLVPFSEVARFNEDRGFATIKAKDQKRAVTVTADVDEALGSADEINRSIEPLLTRMEEQFPGIEITCGGQQEERMKSLGSLKTDFIAALLMIYAILAALFRSYVQPIIVMTAIPFGIIGVILGHLAFGSPLTFFSMIGLVALSGIVVNDSLILMEFINRQRAEGTPAYEAVILGGRARLRAILLTSITTVLGLGPLLTETSFQAKFLIPMGISIAAGLIFATVLTLIGIPTLYMIMIDAQRGLGRLKAILLGRPYSPAAV